MQRVNFKMAKICLIVTANLPGSIQGAVHFVRQQNERLIQNEQNELL